VLSRSSPADRRQSPVRQVRSPNGVITSSPSRRVDLAEVSKSLSSAAAILSPKTAQQVAQLQGVPSPSGRRQPHSTTMSPTLKLYTEPTTPKSEAGSQSGTSHLPPHIRAALAARHAARSSRAPTHTRAGVLTSRSLPASSPTFGSVTAAASVPAAQTGQGRQALRQTVAQRMAALSARRRQQSDTPLSAQFHTEAPPSALPARPTAVSAHIPHRSPSNSRFGFC
jgi:hypothetical protein